LYEVVYKYTKIPKLIMRKILFYIYESSAFFLNFVLFLKAVSVSFKSQSVWYCGQETVPLISGESSAELAQYTHTIAELRFCSQSSVRLIDTTLWSKSRFYLAFKRELPHIHSTHSCLM
jgi:hypothetical protein